MSILGIFIMGVIVSALVGGALWLLMVGAVMDGSGDGTEPVIDATVERQIRERQAAERAAAAS
jgi:hypothetical protein